MTFTDDRPSATPAAPAGLAPREPAANGGPLRVDATAVAPAAPFAGAAARSPWERCDRCQSPVDEQQRYCVECGAHQRRPSDPVARYFAAARRPKAVAAPVPASQSRTVPTAVAAALIALLPVAAGVGILVGRGSADSSDAVIEALKAARVTQGVAAAGATGSAASATDATATDSAAAAGDDEAKDDVGEAKTTGKVDGVEVTDEQAPIIATGPTGSARQLEGSKPTKKDIAESKKAVDQINSRKGDEYIKTQRDLPDTIVIP